MSDNAIVVVKERLGDVERPVLVILAMAPASPEMLRTMSEGLRQFREEHHDAPPLIVVGAAGGGWATMQTDDPQAVRLADELREAVGIP